MQKHEKGFPKGTYLTHSADYFKFEIMQFAGDKKFGKSVLSGYEAKLVEFLVPRVPKFIETYHLTLMTIVWSFGVVIFGYLAVSDLTWLWGVSLMIVLQYLTDLLDGAVGRARNTGLVKWGFFMDHFLDYIFLSSLCVVGFLITPEPERIWIVALLILLSSFLVCTFLAFGATNRFEIYHYGLGPTEFRIGLLIINTIIIVLGVEHFKYTLPLVCIVLATLLVVYCYETQKKIWAIDKG